MVLLKLEIETMKTEEETKMEKLFKKLVGKLSFIQSRAEQEQLVSKFAEEVFGKLSQDKRKKIVEETLSYGILEEFMDDSEVEDIMVNALKPAFTFSSKKGVSRSNKKFSSLEELNLFIKKLLVFSGRDKLDELNDFHLPNGCRANIASSPMGPQITIRKFRHEPLSLIDLIESGMLNYSLGAQLWLYADGLRLKPANILIVGTPGSGKTTLLNALFAFMPPNERVVVIEDTLELNTETNENCARLEASARVSMAALVKNSLRMRPSRIVVGEVRGAEANDLMTAMNIGKICMGTLHASSSRDAVTRLENSPMNVPTEIIPLIDVFIVLKQFCTPNGSLRRVVGEVCETGGIEKKVLLSELTRFDLGKNDWASIHASVIYRDRLAEAVGGTPKEVIDELALRAKVLQALAKKNIRSIKDVSEFTKSYYEETEKALKKIGL